MQRTQFTTPTGWHRSRRALLLMCVASLSVLTACSSAPQAEPPLIVRKPKPTQLPAAILLIDTRPSTRTLSEARAWLQDLEAILSGETPK